MTARGFYDQLIPISLIHCFGTLVQRLYALIIDVNFVPFNVLYIENLSFVARDVDITCFINPIAFQPVVLITYPHSCSSSILIFVAARCNYLWLFLVWVLCFLYYYSHGLWLLFGLWNKTGRKFGILPWGTILMWETLNTSMTISVIDTIHFWYNTFAHLLANNNFF